MTDHKFTEEQIIEALEIRMPHDAVCREAYALINRQKASLQEVITLNSKLEAENAKLQRFLDFYEETSGSKKAKTEAIKEFAERLKVKVGSIPQYHFNLLQVEDDIDTLVKEMTEENK